MGRQEIDPQEILGSGYDIYQPGKPVVGLNPASLEKLPMMTDQMAKQIAQQLAKANVPGRESWDVKAQTGQVSQAARTEYEALNQTKQTKAALMLEEASHYVTGGGLDYPVGEIEQAVTKLVLEQRTVQKQESGLVLDSKLAPQPKQDRLAGGGLILGGAGLAGILYLEGARFQKNHPRLARGLKIAAIAVLVGGGFTGIGILAGCGPEGAPPPTAEATVSPETAPAPPATARPAPSLEATAPVEATIVEATATLEPTIAELVDQLVKEISTLGMGGELRETPAPTPASVLSQEEIRQETEGLLVASVEMVRQQVGNDASLALWAGCGSTFSDDVERGRAACSLSILTGEKESEPFEMWMRVFYPDLTTSDWPAEILVRVEFPPEVQSLIKQSVVNHTLEIVPDSNVNFILDKTNKEAPRLIAVVAYNGEVITGQEAWSRYFETTLGLGEMVIAGEIAQLNDEQLTNVYYLTGETRAVGMKQIQILLSEKGQLLFDEDGNPLTQITLDVAGEFPKLLIGLKTYGKSFELGFHEVSGVLLPLLRERDESDNIVSEWIYSPGDQVWKKLTMPIPTETAEPEQELLFTFTLPAGRNITTYQASADGSLIFNAEGNPQEAGSLKVRIPGIEVLSESTNGYAKLRLPGGRIVWVKDAVIASYVPQPTEQPGPTRIPTFTPTPGGETPIPPASPTPQGEQPTLPPASPTPGGVESTPTPSVEPSPVPPTVTPETQPGGAVMAPEEVPAHVNHGGGQFKKQAFDHNIWGVIPESAGREYVVQFRVLGVSGNGLRVDAGGVEKILPLNGAPIYLTNHGYVGTINQLVSVPGVFLDGDAVTVYVQEFALRDTLTDAEIQASSITPIAIMMSGL